MRIISNYSPNVKEILQNLEKSSSFLSYQVLDMNIDSTLMSKYEAAAAG